MKQYLVIDIGGTAIKYALMNQEATIISQDETPTPYIDKDHFFKTLDGIITPVQKTISGIAISMPGRLDPIKGYAFTSGAIMYLNETPIKAILEERYHLPVSVDNDGKCAAQAEAWKGNLSDVNSGIVIILGTGIGGGVVLNHELWRGTHGTAGELSSLTSDFTQHHCIEKRWTILNSYGGLTMPYAKLKQLPEKEVTGRSFFQALENSDEDAKQVFKNFIHTLTSGIITIQAVLDIDKVCIGGGISAQDSLIEATRECVKEYFATTGSRYAVREPLIDRCRFKNEANLIGALKHFLIQHNI